MKKFLKKIDDRTGKIKKIDYLIMGIMILFYSFLSFYHLGDMKAPETYYTFRYYDDEVVVRLAEENRISKLVYFTGNKIGDLSLLVSQNGIDYEELETFTTYSVFSWEERYLNFEALYLKFVAKSSDVTLGDIAVYDDLGRSISILNDVNNPLTDELDLIPNEITYLNSLYFDEIYYARSAYEYVHGIDVYEWTHPPLGKLIIAIPIYFFGYSNFTARLMGNLAGILLIPVMYILTKLIFKNRKYAFLGAVLMMLDTFHFVHTRIALVDGFEVLFILLSVLYMKKYVDLKKSDSFKKKTINLLCSGFFIGCAISTKWNALYPALGLAIVFFIHLFREYHFNLIHYFKSKINIKSILKILVILVIIPLIIYYIPFLLFSKNSAQVILACYGGLILIWLLYYFGKILIKDKYLAKLFVVSIISFVMLPIIVYSLSYMLFPHVTLYNGTLSGIIDETKYMYDYHTNLDATHPFSSDWYSWPIMYKPVWFYSKTTNVGQMTIVDIGNPIIWWFGILGVIYLVISSMKKNANSLWIIIFFLCSYIPYIFIGRIMFMYHYFIALPFVMLGIVGFIKWLEERFKCNKISWIYICLVVIVFWVFYPVVSGMLVKDDYIEALKWLDSWIF